MADTRQRRIQSNLRRRHRLISALRGFFDTAGYLEVETPVRIPAPAPEAHIDPVASDGWYLQTSPELCMKRLVAAGFERIYQICRCFRRGERGGRHLPELTLLEWYTAGAGYLEMMAQTEALVRFALGAVAGSDRCFHYRGQRIDLAASWERLSVAEAFDRYGGVSMARALDAGRFDEVMGIEIEPRWGIERPVFLMDYPAAHGALARPKYDRPDQVERFELYIAGIELCNGFGELTDPVEQRRRFEAEAAARRSAGKPDIPLPEPFLADLHHLPACTGNALGVDRLAMLAAGAASIDDVSTFVPEEL